MKKVTSLLIAAVTSVVFTGSAMAATPAHHASTHKTHATHSVKHHKASAKKDSTKTTPAKKVEEKAPATK